jgi:hypothetical protein
MSDIGTLEERISKLEYYTSLSMLEKAATDMQIPTADGLNRFKNGIFVETFTSHGFGDVSNQEYRIAIHVFENHSRAITTTDRISLRKYTMSGANNIGASYVLNYTPEVFFEQLFVSEPAVSAANNTGVKIVTLPAFRNGYLAIYPSQIHQVDRDTPPQIQSSTLTTQSLENVSNYTAPVANTAAIDATVVALRASGAIANTGPAPLVGARSVTATNLLYGTEFKPDAPAAAINKAPINKTTGVFTGNSERGNISPKAAAAKPAIVPQGSPTKPGPRKGSSRS